MQLFRVFSTTLLINMMLNKVIIIEKVLIIGRGTPTRVQGFHPPTHQLLNLSGQIPGITQD